jgi:tellurite resistance protein
MHHISLAELGTCDATLTQDQALAAIGLAAVSSDGDASGDELVGLLDSLARLGVGDSDEARQDLARGVIALSKRHGPGPVTGVALATLADEHRETALRLAFDVLMADGQLPDDELSFVSELQRALAISDDRYNALLEQC